MERESERKPDVKWDVEADIRGLRAEVATLRDEIAGIRRDVRRLERIGLPPDILRRLAIYQAGRARLDEPALWTALQIPQRASAVRTGVRRYLQAGGWFASRTGKTTYWSRDLRP